MERSQNVRSHHKPNTRPRDAGTQRLGSQQQTYRNIHLAERLLRLTFLFSMDLRLSCSYLFAAAALAIIREAGLLVDINNRLVGTFISQSGHYTDLLFLINLRLSCSCLFVATTLAVVRKAGLLIDINNNSLIGTFIS